MPNFLNINSTTIGTFGFTSTFDILAKTLTLDISSLTTFLGDGATTVPGIYFSVVDPSGLPISTIDLTAPAITPENIVPYVVDLVNGFAVFGWYTIIGQIQDIDGKIYSIQIQKEICQPAGFYKNSYVKGTFNFDVDCSGPIITVSETSPLVYKGLSPDSVTKSGVLSYPRDTLADLDFATTPFSIGGSGLVYTGRYTLNNSTVAIYDLSDGAFLAITYKTVNLEQLVTCSSSLSTIICCLEDLLEAYNNDPYSSTGKSIKSKLDKVEVTFMLAVIKEKAGFDASNEVSEMSDILGCDCDCSGPIEPKAILAGGSTINNLNFVGANAASVTPSTVGSTTTYTVNVKNINVLNSANDTGFSINKVVTGSAITFNITFNYQQLATNILDTIAGNEDLINLLLSIIGAADAGVDLSGLNGGCIITVNNCNYTLTEANNIVKTIISIIIGGTTYTAPTGLILSNTVAVANWLNSLDLGTFTAALDSSTNNVVIASNANANSITVLNISTAAGPIVRLFNKSCIGLVEFLNAIVTYVCAIDSTEIDLGVGNSATGGASGLKSNSFDGNGNLVQTSIPANTSGYTTFQLILAAQATLFTSIKNIALTCTNVQALFKTVSAPLNATDGILGTKGGSCAKIGFDELAGIILNAIAVDSTWQTKFCAIAANCVAPACPAVTNPSAAFTSGTLVVNANGAGASNVVQIRYRIYNSGSTYTIVNTTGAALPLTIPDILTGQYEVGIAQTCANNNVQSSWATAITNNTCAVPTGLTVTQSGGLFTVNIGLTDPQRITNVQMTDPNGNVTNYQHTFTVAGGSFTIPVVTGLFGNYSFLANAVCDATVMPNVVSEYIGPQVVNYMSSVVNNFFVTANYDMTIEDIENGTATGVPISFNNNPISGNASDYTPSLTAGTITVKVSGTVPGSGGPYKVVLTKNGSTLLNTQTLTSGDNTYTLTNPSPINAPDQIGVSIIVTSE